MDVSESLTAHREIQRPRSASSVTSLGNRSDASDSPVSPPISRRKAPAPPNKKVSAASSTSLSSSDERSGTPVPVPGVVVSDENGYSKVGSHRDLVEVGGKRIPAPIIEVHPAPAVEGWITFARE